MSARLSLLVIVTGALAIAGCGGGGVASKNVSSGAGSTVAADSSVATTDTTSVSTTESSSTSPLSRSQLVARADTICRRLNAELGSAKYYIRTQQDVIRVAPLRAATETGALTELEKLTPPASVASAYQRMLVARHTLIEDIVKLGQDAAIRDKEAEMPLFASSAAVVRQMGLAARDSGFKYCSQLG